MRAHKKSVVLASLVLFVILLAACNASSAGESAEPGETTAGDSIQPGDKVAGYLISNARPDKFMVTSGYCPEVGDCNAPAGSSLNIGSGVAGFTPEILDANWESFSGELYINGIPVDLAAFGSIDTVHEATQANSIRLWNVTVEDPPAGELTLRWVTSMDGEELDETFKVFFK
jgi:hypothetical protein